MLNKMATPPRIANATSPRQQQADLTRERLLGAAWDIVCEAGPSAFSMRTLAARANVATGLPFAHFGSREALLDELRIRAWDQLEAAVVPDPPVDPATLPASAYETGLRTAMTAIADFALREPFVYDLVAIVPGMRLGGAVLEREVRAASRLVAFLRAGEAAGAFRFERDVVVFALALWTSLQGFVTRMRADLDPGFRAIQQRVLEEVLDSFCARIRPEAPR
jgi:AcrR family transcriptional regulator